VDRDRHRFDADPDPVPVPNFHFDVDHSFTSLQGFIFLISVKYLKILSILDSVLKLCGKKYSLPTFSYA
jgi:hypothetical protein